MLSLSDRRPFCLEDTRHIPLSHIRELNKSSDLFRALQILVQEIWFDRRWPQNHNVRWLRPWNDTICQTWDGLRWTDRDMRQVADIMTIRAADLMREHIDKNPSQYHKSEDAAFDVFYNTIGRLQRPSLDTCHTIVTQSLAPDLPPPGAS
jgi:hypothetical protein